jgi:exopolysaccharide production protein ExoZ
MRAHLHSVQLPNLQALRAIAAMMVVLFHFMNSGVFNNTWPALVVALYEYLTFGVDVFFVLSGFIITLSVYKNNSRVFIRRHFIISRFIRIYPVYWIFFILLAVFFSLPNVNAELGGLEYLLKSFFLLPVFNEDLKFYPLLYVGWSLVFELYFYFVFSLSYSKSLRKMIASLLICLGLLYQLGDFISYEPLKYLLQSNLILEFFAGVLMFFLYQSKYWISVIKMKWFVAPILACALVIIFILYKESDIQLRLAFSTTILIFFLLFDRITFNSKTLVSIGDASYTLYLSHAIIQMAYSSLWKRDLLMPPAGFEIFAVIGSAFSCILFALYFYKYIEMPMTKYLNQQHREISIKKTLSG